MNEKEIQENNVTIAKFMGAVKSKMDGDSRYLRFPEPIGKTYAFYPKDLKYHSSWDWIMPVVEKINRTELSGEKFDMIIFKTTCHINNQHELLSESTSNNFIECVWLGVIQFIKHYNTLSQSSSTVENPEIRTEW